VGVGWSLTLAREEESLFLFACIHVFNLSGRLTTVYTHLSFFRLSVQGE